MAEWVLDVIREGRALSVHDISTGGLAIAAAEMCLASGRLGIELSLDSNPVNLYSETPGYLVEVSDDFAGSAGSNLGRWRYPDIHRGG